MDDATVIASDRTARTGLLTGPPRRLSDERGQMMPIYVIVLFSLIALGALLFQVGRAATLRSDAQTAADSAALAGAKELAEQLYSADGSISAFDESAVRAATENYASQNDAEVTDFEVNACGVRVEVETLQKLDGDEAEEVNADGDAAEGLAAAAMGTSIGSGGGLFGAPADGPVPAVLKPAADLAQSFGLQVTSTTGGTHSPGSFHYQGLAIDVSNSQGQATAEQAMFYEAAKKKFDGRILELFYDPLGKVQNNVESPEGIGDHTDHVHLALSPTKIAGAPSLDGQGSGDGFGSLVSEVAGPQLVSYEDVSECALGSVENLLSSGYLGFVSSASSAEIAKTICRIGNDRGVSDRVMLSAFETGIVESGMQNLDYGDRDSLGVFQQRPSQDWGTPAQVTDVAYATNSYFDGAIANEGSYGSPGELAQSVQRSAYPDRYNAAETDARALMQQVGCSAGGGSGDSSDA